jgi:hypothetical protein
MASQTNITIKALALQDGLGIREGDVPGKIRRFGGQEDLIIAA